MFPFLSDFALFVAEAHGELLDNAVSCLGVIAIRGLHQSLVRTGQWLVRGEEEGGSTDQAGVGCDATTPAEESGPSPDACESGVKTGNSTGAWDTVQSEGSDETAKAVKAEAGGRVTRAGGAAAVRGEESE